MCGEDERTVNAMGLHAENGLDPETSIHFLPKFVLSVLIYMLEVVLHKETLIYLKPKVTLHCFYIYLFWVLVSGILNVFNSY